MTIQEYYNRLANMSGEELYKKIRQKYWDVSWFALAYNKALNNYAGADKDKYRDLISKIEAKVGEYMKAQQNKNVQKNNTQSISVDNLPTKVDFNTKINKPKLPKEPTPYDLWFQSWFNSALWQFSSKLSELQKATNKALESFKNKLWLTDKQLFNLKNRFDVFNQKVNLIDNIIKSKDEVYQNLFKWLKENLDTLSEKYGDTYAKIWERLNNYEKLMWDTFNKMKERLNKIWENYKKILQFNQAAAGSAAEKQLRWATGKWAQLRVANYLQEFAQKWDTELAKLQVQLAQQANALDQEFLRLKKLIINDKNLTDREKVKVLDDLQNRYNNLLNLQAKWWISKVDAYAEPRQEQLAKEERDVEAIQAQKLQNVLQKLNYEWATNPKNRDIIINKIISQLKVPIPKEYLQKLKTAKDFNEALLELKNYVNKNTQVRSALDKLLQYSKTKNNLQSNQWASS